VRGFTILQKSGRPVSVPKKQLHPGSFERAREMLAYGYSYDRISDSLPLKKI